MQTFRTVFPEFNAPFNIQLENKLLFLGSCFSTQIGNKFLSTGFHCAINPFGTLFNPISIFNNALSILQNIPFEKKNLTLYNNHWYSLNHYSKFSDNQPENLVLKLNHQLYLANKNIANSSVLFLTLGSSKAYFFRNQQLPVANCHKIPAKEFSSRLLTIPEMLEAFNQFYSALQQKYRDVRVVLTVSPVRHLKDGFTQNALSKARLIELVHQIVSQNTGVYYFPAYEIVMDDLRDYRFYSNDLVHPASNAENYIWQYIEHAFFSKTTISKTNLIKQFVAAQMHKPINSNLTENLKFTTHKTQLEEKIKTFLPEENFKMLTNHLSKISN